MTYHNAVKFIKNAPHAPSESNKFERIRLLCEELGEPHRRIKYLRLAGSNGKTLCGGMLASVLKKADIRVGYLAMPPREEPRQNILIDTEALSMSDVVKYATAVSEAVARINARRVREAVNEDGEPTTLYEHFVPSSEEILFSMALIAFCDKGCELCLIESDHEGNDPSLFLPPPLAAVICGTIPCDDKKEISRIRSYITRGVAEIISAPQDQSAYRVLSDTCASVNCRLTLALKSAIEVGRLTLRETEFSYKGAHYALNLCGRFQIVNATVVLETLEMLTRRGFSISREAIADGFLSLNITSKFEVLSVMPFIIADSTHTPVAIETVCDSMTDFREMTGSRVRLCLPSRELFSHYYTALSTRGYEITDTVLFGEDGEGDFPCSVKFCKTVKATVKASLAELSRDTVLLISGQHKFTEAVRYELLQALGF